MRLASESFVDSKSSVSALMRSASACGVRGRVRGRVRVRVRVRVNVWPSCAPHLPEERWVSL